MTYRHTALSQYHDTKFLHYSLVHHFMDPKALSSREELLKYTTLPTAVSKKLLSATIFHELTNAMTLLLGGQSPDHLIQLNQ